MRGCARFFLACYKRLREWIVDHVDALTQHRRRQPLINTADEPAMRMAATLLAYPFGYCRKEDNRARLIEASGQDIGVIGLVTLLQKAQDELANELPLAGSENIWSKRAGVLATMGIATSLDIKAPNPSAIRLHVQQTLNTRILESLVDTADSATGPMPPENVLRLASACIWLSDHLSLVVLGIARCRMNAANRLTIEPVNTQARRHLRRLWFGSAFDSLSLEKATASFVVLAYEMTLPERNRENLSKAFASALAVFPQQWRLPCDVGPVQALLHDYLRPLVRILSNVIIARQVGRRPLRRIDAKQLKAEKVFDLIFAMQSAMPPVDRLFDIVNDGLVLGTRTLGPGVLAIAEHIASQVLGANWHNDASEFQKADLCDRLNGLAHIQILDAQLFQHDTQGDVSLDVDLFVRDLRHGKIYAVQLKHFEASDKGGILYWIAQLRAPKSKLGKAITQLMHLPELLETDAGIQAKLNKLGIATAEFRHIVPVVVHNIGPLDFWEVQSGVLLHDMLTFCNVLKGRIAGWIGKVDDEVVTGGREGMTNSPSLHESDKVIAAYLGDPLFARRLEGFDLAAHVTRSVSLGDMTVTAKGLGV